MPRAPAKHHNPFWKPREPWANRPVQAKRHSSHWAVQRLRIFERDRYVCQLCQLVTLHPECDHRVPLAHGGDDTDDNLQTLCKDCHDAKSKRELTRARTRGDIP